MNVGKQLIGKKVEQVRVFDSLDIYEEIKEGVRMAEERMEEICKDCPMKCNCNKKGCGTSD